MSVIASQYNSLQEALDAAAAANDELIINGTYDVADTLVIPQNILGIDGFRAPYEAGKINVVSGGNLGLGVLVAGAGGLVPSQTSLGRPTSSGNFFIRNLEVDGNGLPDRSTFLNEVSDIEVSGCNLHSNRIDSNGDGNPAIAVYHNSQRITIKATRLPMRLATQGDSTESSF